MPKNNARNHLLVVKNKETSRLQTVVKKYAKSRLKTVRNDKIPLKPAKNNARIRLMPAVKSAMIRQMFAKNSGKNRLKCVKSVMLRLNVV